MCSWLSVSKHFIWYITVHILTADHWFTVIYSTLDSFNLELKCVHEKSNASIDKDRKNSQKCTSTRVFHTSQHAIEWLRAREVLHPLRLLGVHVHHNVSSYHVSQMCVNWYDWLSSCRYAYEYRVPLLIKLLYLFDTIDSVCVHSWTNYNFRAESLCRLKPNKPTNTKEICSLSSTSILFCSNQCTQFAGSFLPFASSSVRAIMEFESAWWKAIETKYEKDPWWKRDNKKGDKFK